MPAALKLEGRRFARLLVLERAGRSCDNKITWRVRCDCGSETEVRGVALVSGNTTSCGCAHRPHGGRNTPEYAVWASMLARCTNPRHKNFADYGGRGIRVDPAWAEDFAAFIVAVGRRPGAGYQIERIDNDRGYAPGNVRWATAKEQARNRRSSVVLEYKGRRQALDDWAKEFGLGRTTLGYRLRAGWSVERALETPVRGA